MLSEEGSNGLIHNSPGHMHLHCSCDFTGEAPSSKFMDQILGDATEA